VASFAELTRPNQPPAPAAPPLATPGELHPYVAKLLGDECAAVRGTLEGGRNSRIYEAAGKVGHWVPAYLSYAQAEAALTAAGLACGEEPTKVRTTVRSGLKWGMKSPRNVPGTPGATVIEANLGGMVPDGTGRAGLVRLSDVVPERVTWLWPGYLPAGKLSLIEGDPSVGKSTLMADLAARVTTGARWPDGAANPHPPSGVLILSAEDGLADTVRPRFDVAGGDPDRAFVLDSVRYTDESGAARERLPTLPDDAPLIRDIVIEHDVRLIIVDVLMAFLGGKVDAYRDQDVRAALAPLARLCAETGAVMLPLRHLTKGAAQALYRGGGSIGIIGAARTCYLVGRDPDDRERRMIASQKNNLAPDAPTLAYRIEGDEATGTGRIVWEPSPVPNVGPSDLLVEQADRSELSEAATWLACYLSEQGGSAKSADARKAARAEGITDKALRVARERLHVATERVGWPSITMWSLPEAAPVAPTGAQSRPATRVGTTGHDWAQGEDSNPRAAPPSGAKEPRLCSGCGAEPVAPFGVLCPACRDIIDPRATGRTTRDEDQ